ncbi:MAG TPA: phosphoribosylanthranilate isomerase [Terracidiphilus sp.]|jgi:phosphoribosylanthranilate isomerase
MSNSLPLWIKICANTSLEDAQLAAEAGAGAVGFVFAPSPRRVTTVQVAAITPHLPATLEKIGVFVDAPFDEISESVRVCNLTGVQLHSEAGAEMPARLRLTFGPRLRILRVVHFGSNVAEQAAELSNDRNVDAILVDSRTATAVGGTGIPFDWPAAAEAVFNRGLRLVAAGGLTPDNVAEAIATLHPWGVDVASGVEASPGRKDHAKVRAFLENARAAATAVMPPA